MEEHERNTGLYSIPKTVQRRKSVPGAIQPTEEAEVRGLPRKHTAAPEAGYADGGNRKARLNRRRAGSPGAGFRCGKHPARGKRQSRIQQIPQILPRFRGNTVSVINLMIEKIPLNEVVRVPVDRAFDGVIRIKRRIQRIRRKIEAGIFI